MNRYVLAIAVLGLTAGSAEAGNLLINPGFETGSLSPWVADSGSPVITNTEAHSGAFSVSALGQDEIRQNFAPVLSSTITEVSFWVKRSSGPFDAVDFFYSDATVEEFTVSGASSAWTFFNVTADLNLSKSLSGFGVFGSSPGPAFLDDFTINVPSASAVPEPSTIATAVCGLVVGAGALLRRRNRLAV